MTIVDEIRHQIEIEGFALKDFFYTQRPPPVWSQSRLPRCAARSLPHWPRP